MSSKVQAYSVVTLTPGWLASQCPQLATLTTGLFRSLMSPPVPFQSLLSWIRRVKHSEVICFPVAHHSPHDGASSVLSGETGCGGTASHGVFRGEESGAGLSSTGWVAVKSAVVSAAAFHLPFHGHTAHILSASSHLTR